MNAKLKTTILSIAVAGSLSSMPAMALIVHNSDVEIRSTNPDLSLVNTSPNQADWILEGDEPCDECFGISHQDGAFSTQRTPFVIENNTENNLLYLDAAERIGVRTSAPRYTVDVVGDRIRLRNGTRSIQMRADGSSLDLQGIGRDLFIRSSKSAGPGPRRDIIMNPYDSDGYVGIGTTDPEVNLHVVRSQSGYQNMLRLENKGTLGFQLFNSSNNYKWAFRQGDAGNSFVIGAGGQPNANANAMKVFASGNMFIGGTLTQGSSRAIKEKIETVDPLVMLDKVSKLPVSEWSYKADEGKVRHVGPMAEDFYAAFGVGSSPKGLSSIDTGGVALAAIKGLNKVVKEKEARIAAQEQEIIGLKERLASLEKMVNKLAAKDQVASAE